MGQKRNPRNNILKNILWMRRRVCNRAAVVDGGDVRVSPHSRLRRQCGVIEVVTAPRLISPRHLQAQDSAEDDM